MSNAAETRPTDWTDAAISRRETAIQRIGVSFATALIVTPVVGATFSLIWAAAYLAVQLIEIEVFKPLTGPKRSPMGRWRGVLGCVVLTLNTTLYCLPAIPLWLIAGPMGGLAATVMLSAAILYSTLNAPSSSRVLLCTVTPEFLFLGATPIFMSMLGAPRQLVITATAAVVVFAVYCLVGWQKQTALRQRDRLERAAIDARQRRAEREAERRSAYLAAVAHDLRTPIGAILTGAAELERGAVDHAARSQTALINDAGLMMKALLDDLLDHSRLEAGAMSIEAADFNLRALLAQTLRLWAGPIKGKGLELRIEGAHQMPAMVRGDAMRLRQVLNNLISNAMKFTEAGSITLDLQAWPDEHGAHVLLISVADTGPGMSAEQMARLFTPFDQTTDGVAALYGGSGLGLAISRDLIQLMGGRLTVRSAPGQGAVFTISLVLPRGSAPEIQTALTPEARGLVAKPLPRATPSPAPQPEIAVAAPPSDEVVAPSADDDRPLRVLVVDDHAINRRAIQLILQSVDCEIAMAEDGMAALQACEGTPFDVIFMDVRMPELDGRETTRRLRAAAGLNAATPVIAVTADTAPEDIAACTAVGMNYFVSKPLTPGALLQALSQVLDEASAAQESAAA